MNRAGIRVGVGARFFYEGETVEIVEIHVTGAVLEALVKSSGGPIIRRLSLEELLNTERAQLLSVDDGPARDDAPDVASVVLWAAPEAERRLALERAAHVREVLTGYRPGNVETALSGEPRKQLGWRGRLLAAPHQCIARGSTAACLTGSRATSTP
ncbi:hypothetical protein [Mycolicibacterium mucogenicum]|uniref:hypothetical protein n=1 Tax=Mycolicibacterium mucogenicum TaxID=56689 RepID=UPI000A6DC476|nr:hypothetical protein [Mycolicibacterium mucogenicum]